METERLAGYFFDGETLRQKSKFQKYARCVCVWACVDSKQTDENSCP